MSNIQLKHIGALALAGFILFAPLAKADYVELKAASRVEIEARQLERVTIQSPVIGVVGERAARALRIQSQRLTQCIASHGHADVLDLEADDIDFVVTNEAEFFLSLSSGDCNASLRNTLRAWRHVRNVLEYRLGQVYAPRVRNHLEQTRAAVRFLRATE